MHGPPRQADVTDLLHRWQGGDAQALDELTPLVYRELHRIAGRHIAGEQPGHTLQATALAMSISTGTIKREWTVARAWLYQRLAAKPPTP
jgi:hypothetical protein